MKVTKHCFFRVTGALLAVLLLMPLLSAASETGSDRRDRGGVRDMRQGDQEMLENLLDLSTQRLARTRSVIERLEAMDEREREILRKRVREFHRQTPEEIRRQREKWRSMSPEERDEYRRRHREEWQGLRGADRENGDVDSRLENRFKDYFKNLDGEEQRRVLRELRAETATGGRSRE